jgi:dihydrolipoamide dehydrogenase
VLARAARLARDARQFERYGLVGEQPEVDIRGVLNRAQQVVFSIHEKKQLLKTLDDAGIVVHHGSGAARFLDSNTIMLDDGVQLGAEKFILCVGGHARRLNFPGAEHALTHSDIWELNALPRKVAIIGASATGCQLGSIFDDFGARVWMLEVGDRILGLADPSISSAIHRAFDDRGIITITGIGGVERIEELSGSGKRLIYIDGDSTEALDVDAVVLAVGWPGNIENLNLEGVGVNTDRGYILTDDYLRTTAGHIYAAGDITGRMGLVQRAGYDARVAAENAVLGDGMRYRHQIVPHGGFTDPEYGSVGLTEERARAGEDVVVAEVSYENLDRAVIDGRTRGCCKLIVSRETHRIVGAHVVGEQALEIIHLVAAGMAADMWVEQLAELEIAYPTYTAIVGLAARQIIRDLGVVPLAPQWRALGKSLSAEWERKDN